MLQQTQVARVEGYYHRFLARYPTLEDLASAPPATCARAGRAWATIDERSTCTGWPRKSCKTEEASFPRIPVSSAGCRESGGTPRRRSRALLSSARSPQSTPTWPGCFAGCSIPGPDRRRWFDGSEQSAAMLLPRGGRKAWMFNQAIMELGALVCTARVPHCGTCPVRAICQTAVRETGRTSAASLRQGAQPAREVPAIEATIRWRARNSSK